MAPCAGTVSTWTIRSAVFGSDSHDSMMSRTGDGGYASVASVSPDSGGAPGGAWFTG